MNSRAIRPRQVAVIDEARCIGCTLCIQACPFDAILGAAQQMHAVLTALCTGCDLCVAPCPVDCIAMVPATGADAHWDRPRAQAARKRAKARSLRLARDQAERTEPDKRAAIEAAIERARTRRGGFSGPAGNGSGGQT